VFLDDESFEAAADDDVVDGMMNADLQYVRQNRLGAHLDYQSGPKSNLLKDLCTETTRKDYHLHKYPLRCRNFSISFIVITPILWTQCRKNAFIDKNVHG
jgi:hypothetical protein